MVNKGSASPEVKPMALDYLVVTFHRKNPSDSVDFQGRQFCGYAMLPIIESGSKPMLFIGTANNSISGAGYFGK
jgi:hypothetical protein